MTDFINAIRKILIEDATAGLSADGVASNSAGSGKIDGIGVGPRGEPGARKRRAARRKNPKDLAMKSEELERSRFAVDDEDLDEVDRLEKFKGDVNSSDGIAAAKKEHERRKKAKGSKFIAIEPELSDRPVTEGRAGGTVRVDYLVRIGLGDVKKIYYYRQAINNPEAAVKNPTLRPYVAEVLEKTLDLIFTDSQLFNRFRTLLQKQDRPRGEDTLPEDRKLSEGRFEISYHDGREERRSVVHGTTAAQAVTKLKARRPVRYVLKAVKISEGMQDDTIPEGWEGTRGK